MVQEKQSARLSLDQSQEERGIFRAFRWDRRSLSEAIAVAMRLRQMRLGHLLDFPEHPHKGYAQTDDDAEEQQRQTGGCKHLKHA
jgi:hypothetical protein